MGFAAREVVRILLGYNESNRCEIVICYLGAWEGKKITSVKRDHTFQCKGEEVTLWCSLKENSLRWVRTLILSCMTS